MVIGIGSNKLSLGVLTHKRPKKKEVMGRGEPGSGRSRSHGNTLDIAEGRWEGRTPDVRSKPKREINGIKQGYLYQSGYKICK